MWLNFWTNKVSGISLNDSICSFYINRTLKFREIQWKVSSIAPAEIFNSTAILEKTKGKLIWYFYVLYFNDFTARLPIIKYFT